tara:strand:+ start:61 stop:534 length:474 start_codon:yes stop_codon:yes gene_type:complete
MIEVDIDNTSEFNRVITSMLDEMIRVSEFSGTDTFRGIISFGFDELVERMTIQNIMSVSMDEENEKALVKNDDIELVFTGDKYGDKKESCTCCICLCEIEKDDYIYKCSSCNNYNHYNCMNEWLKMKIECPTCRKSLDDQVIIKDDFHRFIEEELDI